MMVKVNAGNIPALLSGDRQVLDDLINHSDMTPAMQSAVRVVNLLTNSSGFDAAKVSFSRNLAPYRKHEEVG